MCNLDQMRFHEATSYYNRSAERDSSGAFSCTEVHLESGRLGVGKFPGWSLEQPEALDQVEPLPCCLLGLERPERGEPVAKTSCLRSRRTAASLAMVPGLHNEFRFHLHIYLICLHTTLNLDLLYHPFLFSSYTI